MRLITGFLFLLNLAIWIAFDVICWSLTGVTLGLVVLIGIVGFLIAWGLSGEAVIVPFDYLAQPEWNIFTIKLKWANSTGGVVMLIFALICIVMDWLELRSFLDIQI
jgi:hypothetical protein